MCAGETTATEYVISQFGSFGSPPLMTWSPTASATVGNTTLASPGASLSSATSVVAKHGFMCGRSHSRVGKNSRSGPPAFTRTRNDLSSVKLSPLLTWSRPVA